ncbi:MAG: HDOD domain-containing protein, partial [Pseudomonadota bacterium]
MELNRISFDEHGPASCDGGDLGELRKIVVERISKGDVDIPPYPAVAERLGRVVSGKDFGLKDLARIIRVDPVLSAAVLRHANSAAFRFASEVTNLDKAITRIGVQQLMNIVFAFGLAGILDKRGPLLMLRHFFWRNAVLGAEFCRRLAGFRKLDEEEAFLAGILRGLGNVVAIGCIEEAVVERGDISPKPMVTWVQEIERHQVELGLTLAENWNLPDVFKAVIAMKRHPRLSAQHRNLVKLVLMADELVEMMDMKPVVTVNDLATINGFESDAELR